jgi:hypothetical protein
VTKEGRDDGGDYGYDMAHEDMAHEDRAHEDRTHKQAGGGPRPDDTRHQRHATVHPGGTADRGEDYGYDEAHGF